MRKAITHEEYLQLLGLNLLCKNAVKKIKDIEEAMADLLEVEDEGTGYYGLVSDATYDTDSNMDELLKDLEISVLKKKK